MLLTIRAHLRPAAELGYLLHKHPDRLQSFELCFGKAWVYYPELSTEVATCALLLEVDPVALGRGRRRGGKADGHPLGGYVNDRSYVASSFLSVALAQVFGTALNGRCKGREELCATPMSLELGLAALPLRGGEALLRRLFEPLGYEVEANRTALDPAFPDWGESVYARVVLRGTFTLQQALSHLYVLVPVLDDDKHYFIGQDEVDKLLRHGEGWLAEHPAKDEVAHRYLLRRRSLARQALARLQVGEPDTGTGQEGEAHLERPLRLNDLRLDAVVAELRQPGVRRVLDLGCGEGKLLERLLRVPQFDRVWGMDTALRSLERAARRLHLEEMAPRMRARLELLHGSLCYVDPRLAGFDAAALVEVIEHIDPPRLAAVEEVVFGRARPQRVVVTTPNREFNQCFAQLPAGQLRHRDHRFEWDRAEFAGWAGAVAERRGYRLRIEGVGEADPELGPPCQMAVLERED